MSLAAATAGPVALPRQVSAVDHHHHDHDHDDGDHDDDDDDHDND